MGRAHRYLCVLKEPQPRQCLQSCWSAVRQTCDHAALQHSITMASNQPSTLSQVCKASDSA